MADHDERYIYRRGGGTYYVSITVPVKLRDRLGRKLIQTSLETADLLTAQDRRWAYINGYRRAFEKAIADLGMSGDEIMKSAEVEIARQKRLEERLTSSA